jgi:hypothetical protein
MTRRIKTNHECLFRIVAGDTGLAREAVDEFVAWMSRVNLRWQLDGWGR